MTDTTRIIDYYVNEGDTIRTAVMTSFYPTFEVVNKAFTNRVQDAMVHSFGGHKRFEQMKIDCPDRLERLIKIWVEEETARLVLDLTKNRTSYIGGVTIDSIR